MENDEIRAVPIIPAVWVTGLDMSQKWIGRLLVTTESASQYVLDNHRGTLRRIRGTAMPDDPEVAFPSRLRRDGEEIKVLRIVRLALGERLIVDVEPLGDPAKTTFTRRSTTYVTQIRELPDEPGEDEP